MKSILESVEWEKPALLLLDQMKNLDRYKHAVMHIRHSTREQTGYYAALSEEGKKAACEFRTLMPSERKPRL
jgi:hypothetical protein